MLLIDPAIMLMVAMGGARPGWDGPNPLANASFELGQVVPEGWELANGTGTAFLRDTSVAKFGHASACMEVSPKGAAEYPAFKYLVRPVTTGQEYSASAWVRTRAMTDLGGYVVLEFFKQDTRLSFVSSSFTGAGDHDWHELTVRGIVPEEADTMKLALVAHGQGKVWFDDARLIRTAEPPPEFTGDRVRLRVRPDRVLCDPFLGFGAQGDFFLTRDFNVKRGVTPQDIELVQNPREGHAATRHPAVLRLQVVGAAGRPPDPRRRRDEGLRRLDPVPQRYRRRRAAVSMGRSLCLQRLDEPQRHETARA
jgi:hypothetical protein